MVIFKKEMFEKNNTADDMDIDKSNDILISFQ